MKKYLFLYLILILTLAFFSCKGEKTVEKKITNDKPTESSSVVIKYNVSGKTLGTITLMKKNNDVRVDLTKTLNEVIKTETRFISNGYLYFFTEGFGGSEPVKSPVIKDHNYHKSFSAFLEASEFLNGMKKIGSDKILGYDCENYVNNIDNSSFSVYNNKYVLKALFDGTMILATSIDFNPNLDTMQISPPSNINFTDIDNQ